MGATQVAISKLLKTDGYIQKLVTDNKKFIFYDNPKYKKSYLKLDQPGKSEAKPIVHDVKVIFCILWDQKSVLYYELLKPAEIINDNNSSNSSKRLAQSVRNLQQDTK